MLLTWKRGRRRPRRRRGRAPSGRRCGPAPRGSGPSSRFQTPRSACSRPPVCCSVRLRDKRNAAVCELAAGPTALPYLTRCPECSLRGGPGRGRGSWTAGGTAGTSSPAAGDGAEVKNAGQRERTARGEAGGRTSVCGPSLRSAANGPPDSWYNASVRGAQTEL